MFPISERHCFWKVPRLRPFVLLVRTSCRCIEIGGRMLTGENIITYPTATLLTIKLTWNDLGSNPSFHAERTATAWPVERPVQAVINLNHGERFSSYRAWTLAYQPTCSDYDIRVHGNWTRETLCIWRNIEARSRNHCCRGKAIRITYSECVRGYPTCKAHSPYYVVMQGLPGSTTFLRHNLINGTMFGK